MKKACIMLAVLAAATMALAQVSAKYKDWPKSPEAYFLTPAERAEWSSVANDQDAERLIGAYYAKRGGDRFKNEISRRIAAADSQFKLRRQRGAESARGHLLITLGGPSRVSTGPQDASGGATAETGLNARPEAGSGFGSSAPGAAVQTWMYAKDKFDPSWGIGELSARINVDASRGTDELQNPDPVNHAIAIVAEKSIVNAGATPIASGSAGASTTAAPAGAPPAATAAPSAGTGATAPVRPAAPPAAAGSPAAPASPAPSATAAIPPATRKILDGLAREKKDSGSYWGGSFRSIPGDPFYAVELSVPAEKAPAATAKFAGLVTSESGQDVATFWDDATLTDVKTGNRFEKIYERSVVLPPGSYRGTFALVSPDGATTLASGTSSFQLHAKTGDFEVSPLILASTLTPLTKRPAPTDPFVFGMEKPIRVDPKGNRLFARDESLWYFYTITNPKASAGAAGAPAAPAADAARPRIMARIGVLREGQPAFAPFSGPAELQPLAADYYGTGSEIPLTSFEPGYYTFSLNVRDLNAPRESAAFKGVDRKEEFVVLKPDGSMPEHRAAAPAKSAPKPAPKPAPKAPPKKPTS